MSTSGRSTGVYDVAIVGSGFAGSILARVLVSRGLRVLLLEKGQHPRFALGESTTPLANLSLERLARRYGLPDLHQIATYGRWRRHLPHLRCGLKRGFTFYGHRLGEHYTNSAANEYRLLVAASPDDELADTHWLRRDVDHHLLRAACDSGVEYRHRTEVRGIKIGDDGVTLRSQGDDGEAVYVSRYVVDATGAGGIAPLLGIEPRAEPTAFASSLLYGHFRGVGSLSAAAPSAHLGDGPYPEERAAIHHILGQDVSSPDISGDDISGHDVSGHDVSGQEGWMYQLPFDHGIVSAGLVLRRDPGLDSRVDHRQTWLRILERYPTLAAQFRDAEPVSPVRYLPKIQYRMRQAAGQRFFLLPHAYAFFDPMFSTGIAWSLAAVERLAELLVPADQSSNAGSRSALDGQSYAQLLADEADHIETLIEAAYLAMPHFRQLADLSLAYFTAASYQELRQRLSPDASCWDGFLGARDPVLGSLFCQARDRLRGSEGHGADHLADDFGDWLRRSISSRDLCGFDQPARRGLFPVDLDMLVERADRIGLDATAMINALPRLRGGYQETQ